VNVTVFSTEYATEHVEETGGGRFIIIMVEEDSLLSIYSEYATEHV
jgi:hypothetical protein